MHQMILLRSRANYLNQETEYTLFSLLQNFGRQCSSIRCNWLLSIILILSVAYLTLAPLLGTFAAGSLFAVALLASGQSSTITGTLAGQVVMEGFMNWRIKP